LPYTSIIEQNAGVFRNAIGAENVVEHHSVVESVKNTEENQLAADNWDAPVIVSTNVQFWETLFGRGNGRLRKLHNIANSVIIMDECQMIPPQYVGLAVETMQELVGRYGCSILFSTATQPQFPSLTGVVELMSDPQNLADRLKRGELHWPNSL
jgi:CRISPR-associated endonuclease/helicase Cas3